MAPQTYSKTQIALHWIIALLVLFQIVVHDEIVRLWAGRIDGTLPNAPAPAPNAHVAIGILILALVVWRLVLRLTRGVPALPADEHPALKLVASGTHILFYVLLIGMPLSGAAAWILGVTTAAQAHSIAEKLLILLIALHLLAALTQHFWFRTDALKRMLGRA
ncbi:MAG: cytochrome b/b6 domain-containing protein [Devosia sp.]